MPMINPYIPSTTATTSMNHCDAFVAQNLMHADNYAAGVRPVQPAVQPAVQSTLQSATPQRCDEDANSVTSTSTTSSTPCLRKRRSNYIPSEERHVHFSRETPSEEEQAARHPNELHKLRSPPPASLDGLAGEEKRVHRFPSVKSLGGKCRNLVSSNLKGQARVLEQATINGRINA